MKLKKIIIIITIIIVVLITLLVGLLILIKTTNINQDIKSENENIEIDPNIEGKYTGYKMILTVSHGDSGIAGQDLESGTIIKTYNISEGDIFYEPIMGGIWQLNTKSDENEDIFKPKKLLK